MHRILALILGCSVAAWAEDAAPKAALEPLAKEVAAVRVHATKALAGKDVGELNAAYAEIDALVAKFETWEAAAYKAGWNDVQIETEETKAGWTAATALAKKLKDAGASGK